MTGSTLARYALLATLYFAQGLPFGFFVQTLPVVLRESGYTLTQIGLASLLTLPWALKFVWAPLVDRVWSPRLGRRRTWILAMQAAAVVVLTVLAIVPSDEITVLMIGMFVLNVIAATQDIATDGMAVEILPSDERGVANGIQVAGYRVGMIFGGGVLLGLYGDLGAHGTFAVMAGMTALASVPVVMTRESAAPAKVESAGHVHFLRLPGAWRLIAIALTFKLGEAFAKGMLRPFLVDEGLDRRDVAWMVGTIGFVAGMAGALAGGALVGKLGRRRALVVFGGAQIATVAGYAWLAFGDPTSTELAAWCGVEHFASGMATAALFTCMMDWSRPASGGTDYTVQASAVVIATGLASTLSGISADAIGYAGHFTLACVLCVAAVVAAATLFPRAR